jgi:hypothetical protein
MPLQVGCPIASGRTWKVTLYCIVLSELEGAILCTKICFLCFSSSYEAFYLTRYQQNSQDAFE